MRQLIEVKFIDHTNYTDNDTQDVVGMVLPHNWGPVEKINAFNQSKFMEIYPEIATKEYAQALSCFNAGAGMMEIWRPQLGYTYLHYLLYLAKSKPAQPAVPATLTATAFLDAFNNFRVLSVGSFDDAVAVLSSNRQTEMNKLSTLKTATEALQTAIDSHTGVEEAAATFTTARTACLNLINKVPKAANSNDWANGVIPSRNLEAYFTGICNAVEGLVYTPEVVAVPASVSDTAWNSKYAVVPTIPLVPAVPASITDETWATDYANMSPTGQSDFASIANLLSDAKKTEALKLDALNTAIANLKTAAGIVKSKSRAANDLEDAVTAFNSAKAAAATVSLPVATTNEDWAGGSPDAKATEIVAYLTKLKGDVNGVVYTAAVPEVPAKTTFDEIAALLSTSKQTEVNKLKSYNDSIVALKSAIAGVGDLSTAVATFESNKTIVASMVLPTAASSDWANGSVPSQSADIIAYYTGLKNEAPNVVYTAAVQGVPASLEDTAFLESFDGLSPISTYSEVLSKLSAQKKQQMQTFSELNDSTLALQSAISAGGDMENQSDNFAEDWNIAKNQSTNIPAEIPSDWASGVTPNTDIIAYLQGINEAVPVIQFTPYVPAVPESGPAMTLAPFRQKTQDFETPAGSDIQDKIVDIFLRYPGDIPVDKTDLNISVSIGMVEEVFTLTIQLVNGTGNNANVVATYYGCFTDETVVDGQPYGITSVLANKSPYLGAKSFMTDEQVKEIMGQEMNFTTSSPYIPDPYVVDDTELNTAIVKGYAGPFASTAISRATILIPTYPDDDINLAVQNAAATRMDCNALLGYDPQGVWSVEAAQTYAATLIKDKFSCLYVARALEKAGGKEFIGTGLGTIAGRYCAVAKTASINQIPSSTMYGPFPGTLINTFDENEVLALAKLQINTVYSTSNGPIIWGIRSLHPRYNSYFAKQNVMRVIARILNQTFPVCLQYHHTPNTDRKKANIQNSIQSILDRLIASDDIRASSYVQCDKKNNPDSETNGGELLIIDMVIGFINLIDRYLIRIHATDDTVTVVELSSAGAE